jgi:lysophospholipase L1-like esterase
MVIKTLPAVTGPSIKGNRCMPSQNSLGTASSLGPLGSPRASVNETGFQRAGSWLRWLTLVPTLPIVAVQARRARRVIPRLPDAEGAVEGTCHGSSTSAPAVNLLVLGESTVSGVGASTHELGLAGSIARALAAATGRDVRWFACGKNGATVAKVRDTLLPSIEGRPFDVAVLCVGANDAFRMTSLQRWRQGLTDINRRLLEHGCKRVFISQVPPVGQFQHCRHSRASWSAPAWRSSEVSFPGWPGTTSGSSTARSLSRRSTCAPMEFIRPRAVMPNGAGSSPLTSREPTRRAARSEEAAPSCSSRPVLQLAAAAATLV